MISFNENNTYHPNSAPSDEFLPSINRWTTLGGVFLMGTVGVAITLASCLKYNVTVKSAATVRPAGELRIVDAQMEGTIKSIEVKENQIVKKGDAIAYINDTELQTQKSQRQGNIEKGKLQIAQIDAQILALDRQIMAETNRNKDAVDSAKNELERTQRDYQEKQITTQTQVQEAQANLNIAQEEWQKAQAELKSAIANLRSTEISLAAAQTKRNRYQYIADSGAISQEQFEEAQLTAEQQKQTLEGQKATVEGQKQAIEIKKQAVLAEAAKLQGSLAALHPSQATVAIAITRIAQEKAQGESTLANLNKERGALIQQQVEIQKQLNQEQKELQQIGNKLQKSVLRATSDGIILKLNLRNPNQVVRPGDMVAQIAPQDTPLEIKAIVANQDIDKVAVGQKVQMKVSACPYPDFGTLKGIVIAVSPDTTSSQDNSLEASSPAQNINTRTSANSFKATIQPESLVLMNGVRQCRIQAGMEAQADIISQEETALQFLLRKARIITAL